MDHKEVVTRYAPSPTGFQHIGGIRTALFAYLWARQNDGTFILRIEDTDKSREVSGAIQHTIDALTWLNLNYDYGPDTPGPFGSCLQSDRLAIYRRYAEQLLARGLAYPDPYTADELTAFREQAQVEKRPFLFRDHRPETFADWDGATPLRFKVPEIKRYTWTDTVRGELSAGEEMLDDFIILKGDGYPTYNFAHIIDDLEMGVTHVMRGEEFIASTPKFLSLYDALEIPWPVFVTLPPIMGPDGKKKLSKRDGAKDLLEYRMDGYLPNAMVNFLALIGWNPGGEQEYFTPEELIETFSLERIQRSGGAFNEQKLKWLNKEHIKHTFTAKDYEQYIQDVVSAYDHDILKRLTPTISERIHNQTEIRDAFTAGEYDWAFGPIEYDTSLLQWKQDNTIAAALPRLRHVHQLLAAAAFNTPDTIKEAIWNYAEETGRGQVLWPLRVALTGRERSPDPFVSAYVLGQEESLQRISQACDKIERDAS